MIAKETVPKLPAELSPLVIDARFYLTHIDHDFCGSDYFESFERDFLTPERRKMLQIPYTYSASFQQRRAVLSRGRLHGESYR